MLFIEFMCEKLDLQVYVDPNILSMITATLLTLTTAHVFPQCAVVDVVFMCYLLLVTVITCCGLCTDSFDRIGGSF